MEFINPSVEIIENENIYKFLETVGRVCYKSEEDCLKAKEALDGKNVYGYNLLCKITKNGGCVFI